MRLFLSLALLVAALATPATAADRRCADTDATVHADSVYDTYLACAGVADAFAFLSQQGLIIADTVVRVDVRDAVFLEREGTPPLRILGQFDPEQNLVMVTSMQGQREMAADKPIFGVPYDQALFRSVVAHEVAHVIAKDNFEVAEPTRLAHEYIAYIVQLATLPPQLRQQILDRNPAAAFSNELEINPLIYGLDPEVFAVKAYRHFRSPGVGVTFVQKLLSDDLQSIFPQWQQRVTLDPILGYSLLGDDPSANGVNP